MEEPMHGAFTRLFDKMTEGLMILDASGNAIYANDIAQSYMKSFDLEERFKQGVFSTLEEYFILPADISETEQDPEASLFFNAAPRSEDAMDSSILSIYVSRPSEDGTRLLLLRDIGEGQREAKLNSDFLSLIIHKFSTPIGILNFMLQKFHNNDLGELTESQTSALQKVANKTSALEHMLREMVLFTALQQKDMPMTGEYVDVLATAKDAVDQCGARHHHKEVSVRFELGVEKAIVEMKQSLLRLILESIFDNAITFHNKRQVGITIRCMADTVRQQLRVSIRDDGPGIAPDTQKKILQRSSQNDFTAAHEVEELGLGLPIVKDVMERIGGDVRLESTPGEGTTVHLLFPLPSESAKTHPPSRRKNAAVGPGLHGFSHLLRST